MHNRHPKGDAEPPDSSFLGINKCATLEVYAQPHLATKRLEGTSLAASRSWGIGALLVTWLQVSSASVGAVIVGRLRPPVLLLGRPFGQKFRPFRPDFGKIRAKSRIYPLIFRTASININRIGANAPRLHGFHRFLPRLWELFFARAPAASLCRHPRTPLTTRGVASPAGPLAPALLPA